MRLDRKIRPIAASGQGGLTSGRTTLTAAVSVLLLCSTSTCRDAPPERSVTNMSEGELRAQVLQDLRGAKSGEFRDVVTAMAHSNSVQELNRRDREREAAAMDSYRRQQIEDTAAAERQAREEQRRERLENARLERLANEALYPRPLPRDPQQQADIDLLDRMAGRR